MSLPPLRSIALIALMAAGFFLRVWRLDLTAFNNDEALLSIFASQIGHLRAFPVFGVPTSFGFHNPPLLLYLTAPFFAVSRDPRLAMFFFTLAGTAAIGLTALTARRLWGDRAGLAAGVLVAFSPLAIEHCRRIWGHDTIVFWSALCLYSAVRGIQSDPEKKGWLWLALSMACAAAGQASHLSGALLWIVPLGALALFRPRRARSALGAGALVLLLIYLPWLIRDAVKNHFSEIKLVLNLLIGRPAEPGPPSPFPPVLSWIGILADSFQNNPLQHVYDRFLAGNGLFETLARAGQSLAAFLFLAGLARLFLDAIRDWRENPAGARWAALLFASAAAPLVLFSILPLTAVAAYQLPALVPAAMAGAFLLSDGGAGPAHSGAKKGWIGVSILIFFALFGTIYTIRARQTLAQLDYSDPAITTLRNKTDAMKFIVESAGDIPYSILQEARTPERGIDYWVLYIHFSVTGNSTIPSGESLVFVLHENHVLLPSEAARWLGERPIRTFGPLALFRLSDEEAVFWMEIVEKNQ